MQHTPDFLIHTRVHRFVEANINVQGSILLCQLRCDLFRLVFFAKPVKRHTLTIRLILWVKYKTLESESVQLDDVPNGLLQRLRE